MGQIDVRSIFIILLILAVSTVCYARPEHQRVDKDIDPDAIIVDLSMFDYTPKASKKAALLAFLKRGWDIETIASDYYVGAIRSAGEITKAEIIIKDNTLTIEPVKGFKVKNSWLLNLKKDFLVFLVEESY
jgi:hypothetical protein